MRSGSWFLIFLWAIKLSLGSVMAMPVRGVSQTTVQVSGTPTPAEHTVTPSLSRPDCHGHLASSDDRTLNSDNTSSDNAGKAPSANLTDCHHCCAVGLGRLTALALHPLPAEHPTRIAPSWQSVSLRPGLRPPIS